LGCPAIPESSFIRCPQLLPQLRVPSQIEIAKM
jgi:hypothetical protein